MHPKTLIGSRGGKLWRIRHQKLTAVLMLIGRCTIEGTERFMQFIKHRRVYGRT